ncbi:MAG: hypothetical protein AB1649_26865 [Chloroflexota bacterium]
MVTRNQERLRIIRWYMEETGKIEVDMHDVAEFAIKKGHKAPAPESPVDRLAKIFSKTAREEMRYDKTTGQPYRGYHSVKTAHGSTQLHFWFDIDEATRPQILMSLIARRQQMVGDGVQLTLDAQHWNNIHPGDDPIQIPMDFTEDVEWRLNAPSEENKAS